MGRYNGFGLTRMLLNMMVLTLSLICLLVIALPFFTNERDLGDGLLSAAAGFLENNLGFISPKDTLARFSLIPFAAYLILINFWLFRSESNPFEYLKVLFSLPLFAGTRFLFLFAQGMKLPAWTKNIGLFGNRWTVFALMAATAVLFAVVLAVLDRFTGKKKRPGPAEAQARKQEKLRLREEKRQEKKTARLQKTAAQSPALPAVQSEPEGKPQPTEPERQDAPVRLLVTEVPVFRKFTDRTPEEEAARHAQADKPADEQDGSMASSVSIGVFDAVQKEAELLGDNRQGGNVWSSYKPGNLAKKVEQDEQAFKAMIEMERKVREQREELRQAELNRLTLEQAAIEAEAEIKRLRAEREKAENPETDQPSSEPEETVEQSAPAPAPEIPQIDAGNAGNDSVHKVTRSNESVIAPAEEPADEEEWEPEGDGEYDLFSGVGGLGHAEARKNNSYLLNRDDIGYQFPPRSLLKSYPKDDSTEHDQATIDRGNTIINTLAEFKVNASLVGIIKGPTVTMYEIALAPGVKIQAVNGLTGNIAMNLAVSQVRLLAPIPGKQAIGVEVPNFKRETIGFDELLDSLDTQKMKVPVVLGKKITGENVAMDIASAPHVLIAGTTGSGKSVCVNSMICSILYTKTPSEVKLIMVDPKIVELSIYNGIPHLLTPVITEPKKAIKAMKFLLEEMDRRYRVINSVMVRNISAYNEKIVAEHLAREKMPYIIAIMDEFADLMAVAGKEIEILISRLTAMSRAVGIHLVFATQRPSAEVVTGLIKNNLPTKIAFAVPSKVNSTIILDCIGAENLLGKGDMLFKNSTIRDPERLQGSFLSDPEVEAISAFVKSQGEPEYLDEAYFEDDEPEDDDEGTDDSVAGGGDDALFEQALKIVFDRKNASASFLQRRLSIGYNKAARMIEKMEELGYVGPARGSKPRELIKYPD